MTKWAESTTASLRSRGFRSSGARLAVIEFLGPQDCCLTAHEIFDELHGDTVPGAILNTRPRDPGGRENATVDYVAFGPEHLPGILRLCEAEDWPSFPSDPARALRALSGPGVITVVAVSDGMVAGFAQLLTDGEIQAYLCDVAVAARARGKGVGKKLIAEAFARSGAQRVDLLALEENEDFYRSFDHRTMPGYRIYPDASRNG
jgi:ribosomal protein S18 acetylase RimI-like enzyme